MNYAEFKERWEFDASLFGGALVTFQTKTGKGMWGACYLIVDDDGFLSYVGKSSTRGLCSRIRSHEEKRWFNRAFVIQTNEKSLFTSADVLEQALIRVFQPYANRQRYQGGGDIGTDVWLLAQAGIKAPFHTDEKPFQGLVNTRAPLSCEPPRPGEPKGAYHERLLSEIRSCSLGAVA